MFFNTRHVKLSARDSALLVVKEVSVFWDKACLPTQHQTRCADKLEKLYNEWRSLQKSAGKTYNLEKAEIFKSKLPNLFDIAHGKINEMIDETRREFLLNQRKDGRIGYINDVETIYDAAANAQIKLDELLLARLQKSQLEKESLGKFFLLGP